MLPLPKFVLLSFHGTDFLFRDEFFFQMSQEVNKMELAVVEHLLSLYEKFPDQQDPIDGPPVLSCFWNSKKELCLIYLPERDPGKVIKPFNDLLPKLLHWGTFEKEVCYRILCSTDRAFI